MAVREQIIRLKVNELSRKYSPNDMKKQLIVILGLGVLACAVQAEDKKADDKLSPFKSEKEKISYAIGMNVAGGLKGQLKRQDVEVDASTLAQAFKDTFNDGKTQITEEQSREILQAFTKDLQAKQMEKRKIEDEKRK